MAGYGTVGVMPFFRTCGGAIGLPGDVPMMPYGSGVQSLPPSPLQVASNVLPFPSGGDRAMGGAQAGGAQAFARGGAPLTQTQHPITLARPSGAVRNTGGDIVQRALNIRMSMARGTPMTAAAAGSAERAAPFINPAGMAGLGAEGDPAIPKWAWYVAAGVAGLLIWRALRKPKRAPVRRETHTTTEPMTRSASF